MPQMKRFIGLLFCGIFFVSCGLDEIIFVEEPVQLNNNPSYDSDYLQQYHEFVSNIPNDLESGFLGCDIYYKIYNNLNTMISEKNSIDAVNDDESSVTPYSKLEQFKYQQLKYGVVKDDSTELDERSGNIFFENGGSTIRLRLKTYQKSEDENLRAIVKVDNAPLVIEGSYCQPLRYNLKTFDFFDEWETDFDINAAPVDGDDDFSYSTSNDPDTYYVQLFAINVAWDGNTLSNIYSLVLNLGNVSIKRGE